MAKCEAARSERQSRGHDNGSNGGSHIQTVRLIGCLLGERIDRFGISGTGLVRMVIPSAPSRIDEAGERPPWQPQLQGVSEPVDKLLMADVHVKCGALMLSGSKRSCRRLS